MAKELFMQAKSKLNSLLTFDPAGRNVEHYPNERLEKAMKVCVSNSLLHLKTMAMKGRCRVEMSCILHPACPSLDVTPIAH